MKISKVRLLVTIVALFVVFAAIITASGYAAVRFGALDRISSLFSRSRDFTQTEFSQKILREENIVVDIAERVSPSVVTVTVETPRRRVLEFNPFGGGFNQRFEGGTQQDIGTGFVVSQDGLIITNKHVVDDREAKYKVITKDDREFEVVKIDRDPANDLAVLKIDASGLTPIEIGSSQNLKVGQFVIAIGTALGEFRHTVTTGVVSGLGRGITAGDPFQGFVERLDDVIQTDAAINPGNSGGPLLNSAGQVIGVNVAVASGAQNVGFAIPADTVKRALEQFTANGSFTSRAFLGVQYQMIGRRAALLNEVPEGAYVQDVVADSPAERAGIEIDDIIVEIDGVKLASEEEGLVSVMKNKKPGDTISVKIWRNGEDKTFSVQLTSSEE
jgi:serine protease Do